MEKCEVTWDQYELFMYPDEPPRARRATAQPTTLRCGRCRYHPSKPYVEMSFGWQDGFCISMTSTPPNYCEWSAPAGILSLPRGRMEYACAPADHGLFFGDDASKLVNTLGFPEQR